MDKKYYESMVTEAQHTVKHLADIMFDIKEGLASLMKNMQEAQNFFAEMSKPDPELEEFEKLFK